MLLNIFTILSVIPIILGLLVFLTLVWYSINKMSLFNSSNVVFDNQYIHTNYDVSIKSLTLMELIIIISLSIINIIGVFGIIVTAAVVIHQWPREFNNQNPELEIIRVINKERLQSGCDELQITPILTQMTYQHSQNMVSHDEVESKSGSGNGDTFEEQVHKAGFMHAAQIVGKGGLTTKTLAKQLITEDYHRKFTLSCDFTQVGMSFIVSKTDPTVYYWTLIFTS